MASPIGGIGVTVSHGAVVGVSFGASGGPDESTPSLSPLLTEACRQLREYFAGERHEFSLPVRVTRGSDFDRAVWSKIAEIPYGETATYGDIARAVGDPGAARAVGVACNRNPLPLVVPCHRVIGANGKLVGFGGGLHRKRFLLELEARVRILRDFGQ